MKAFWLLLVIFQNATSMDISWDFGADVGGLTVVALKSGLLEINERKWQISFPVSPCMDVKYVRVQVHKAASTPAVTYNMHTRTVTISFHRLLLAHSTYDIMARGSPNRSCGKHPTKPPQHHHQNPGSYYGHPPNGGHYDPNGHYMKPGIHPVTYHQYPDYEKHTNYDGGQNNYPNNGGDGNYPNYGGTENYQDQEQPSNGEDYGIYETNA